MNKEEKNTQQHPTAILLIHSPDKRGLVATVTEFIYKNDGNILHLDQHVDSQKQVFFMRVEWDLKEFRIPKEKIRDYFHTLIAKKLSVQWELQFSESPQRMAIFVSKYSHCLMDILSRVASGEWKVEVPLIISNHSNLETTANRFEIDYQVIPISKTNKEQQEQRQIELLKNNNIDLIVLARYMQILSNRFISNFPNRIINIHHSFLPAFPGARPYHSAFERGVKIIGATSHYATAELDGGPIIEQDIVHVSHKDSVEDFIRKGRDLEKVVLSRAIWHHINRKILVYDNRTVVFS